MNNGLCRCRNSNTTSCTHGAIVAHIHSRLGIESYWLSAQRVNSSPRIFIRQLIRREGRAEVLVVWGFMMGVK